MRSIRPLVMKELRNVLPLWLSIIVAALIPQIRFHPYRLREFLSVATLYAGTSLLATLPVGYEFQSGTFPFLLAQPIDRRRLWAMKMVVIALSVVPVGFIYLWGSRTALRPETILAIVWLFMTVCSAPYWALVARSIIGGFVLNAMQGALILIGVVITASLSRVESPFHVGGLFPIYLRMGTWAGITLIYSLFMLWLGRRAFVRYQDRGSEIHRDFLSGRPGFQPHLFVGWLRSRQNAPLLNLIGKEVRLLWPIWMFTALGILATAGLAVGRHYAESDGLLRAITIAEFIVATLVAGLAMLLSGTLSIGEEKELGIHAWHRTLPISFGTQWLVKFGIALLTSFFGLGPLLVIGSNLVGGPELPSDANRFLDPALLWIVPLTATLGFWCATVTRGTFRALLWVWPVVVMVMAGGYAGVALSAITRGWTRLLLTSIGSTRIQELIREVFYSQVLPLTFLLPVLLAAGVHSYLLFRTESQEGYRPLIRATIPLVLAGVVAGFVQYALASYAHIE